MFVTAVRKISKAMFPVFRVEQDSPTQFRYTVVGTGFFINDKGGFVSVAHIFDNATVNTSFQYAGLLPESPVNFLPVNELARDESRDIYIGQIPLNGNGFLNISGEEPEAGKTVCIAGYPLAALQPNTTGGIDVGGVRRYFQPSFLLDTITANIDNGQGLTRRHEGMLVRDAGLYGMSGGPVVDINGDVSGVQGSVVSRESISGNGKKIMVENAVAISIKHAVKLLKENNIPYIEC